MRGLAVIGANYGDEGKGLITDYLCATREAATVVRFNGGAQAGHTVVTPDGRRHVFQHFGAGTFAGAETFLSRFFVCNPILFNQEAPSLPGAVVFADPDCMVTTPIDMLLNQVVEQSRGSKRHGSCGVGFNETIERCRNERYALLVRDLHCEIRLQRLLDRILTEYVPYRLGSLGLELSTYSRFIDAGQVFAMNFAKDCDLFMRSIGVRNTRPRGPIVFEGAQGLLLSQDNAEAFPHVTRSYTGLRNALELCDEWGISDLDAVYVSRPYLTRHGAGPLPEECPSPPCARFADETNVPHPFQGSLRFAPLDHEQLIQRVMKDSTQWSSSTRVRAALAVTCLDQGESGIETISLCRVRSYGPSRSDVREAP